MSIIDEIQDSYKRGDNVIKLIYANIAVFIIVKIWLVIMRIAHVNDIELTLDFWLRANTDLNVLKTKPWTLFTYMFLHTSFMHIFFNMLILFWFGRIFLRYLSNSLLLKIYILGGIAGFLFQMILDNLIDFPLLPVLGASGGIMAILVAISFYVPDYTINLLLIGPVRLKYIALVVILLDLFEIYRVDGVGHFTHLGGALFGYLFIWQYKQGNTIGKGFNNFFSGIFKFFRPKKRMKVTYKHSARNMSDMEYNLHKVENQKEIDRILDKIAKAGYDSLSKKEKETLFKMRNKE